MNINNSMEAAFASLGNLLPEALRGPLLREGLAKNLAALPFDFCAAAFGFETSLLSDEKAPGFAFCIPRGKAATFLAEGKKLPAGLSWGDNLQHLLTSWIDSPMNPAIDNLWLEWDDATSEASPLPKIFFSFRPGENPEQDILAGILKSAAEYYNHRETGYLEKKLRHTLATLPRSARITQLGITVKSGILLIRLCLKGLSPGEITAFLPESKDSTAGEELACLLSLNAAPVVHLDLREELLPRLGLELRLPGDDLVPARQKLWNNILETLETKGLCAGGEKEALLQWHGRFWDISLPLLSDYIINRLVYYLKAVFSQNTPSLLKAYWGFMTVPVTHYRNDNKGLKKSLFSANRYLERSQLPWGEWRTYKAQDPHLKAPVCDSTVFTTTFIMDCLAGLKDFETGAMLRRGADFLSGQRLSGGLWSYWSSRSNRSIFPDLDDTCCVSYILEKCVNETGAGKKNRYILRNRDSATNLFRTWVAPQAESNDTDLAVNANILLYLGENKDTEKTIAFLVKTIREGREKEYSHYYLNPLTLYYMVARAFHNGISALGSLEKIITKRLLSNQNIYGVWFNPLYTALALTTLMYYGCTGKGELLPAVNYLLESQRDAGFWPRSAFYAGPRPPEPHSVWFGSEELTTAFCVQALDLFYTLR